MVPFGLPLFCISLTFFFLFFSAISGRTSRLNALVDGLTLGGPADPEMKPDCLGRWFRVQRYLLCVTEG